MNDFGTDDERKKQVVEFKNRLNDISPSFCVAKWKQVTIHLHNGRTHSCHHPVPHHIPLEEIKVDVSSLHNTNYKKEQQKLMLKGIRPSECDYCWRVEDSDSDVFSDRVMKSLDSWARPFMDEIKINSTQNPSYLELSFSNACNFKCSYCTPEVSSKWMEEIEKYGPYPTTRKFNDISWYRENKRMPFLEKEENPYVEAFWKWWPELHKDLKVLRITGGEPLMTKHTFKLLELILNNPMPDLELNINSNLGIPSHLLDKFISIAQKLQNSKAIKSLKIYTSAEAHGSKAEYIRFGLNYQEWLDNCHKLMKEIPQCKLTVMSTYNLLSVTSFKKFLEDMLEFRLQYTNIIDRHPVGIDIPYLRWPEHQSIEILTDDYLPYIEEQVKFMEDNQQQTYIPELCGRGFYDYEINRIKRVLAVFKNRKISKQNRKDFKTFVDEHDRRRGTNFLRTFPEMQEFYNLCENERL